MLDSAAQIATLVSLLVATVSWALERRLRKRQEVDSRRQIWSNISKVRGLMVDLERNDPDGINMATGKLSFMMRDLIQEACKSEPNFSAKTIAQWRKVGKLSSDWQEHLAVMLLDMSEVSDDSLAQLSDRFSNISILPQGHPMRTPWLKEREPMSNSDADPSDKSNN